MTDKKWKDYLLKSSLPLEHVVAADLSKHGWEVWGQYAYARDNESGISVDFSVDLEATKEYSYTKKVHSAFQILIECKYASPGVRWVFLPYPTTAQLFAGVVQVVDQAANKRVTNRNSFMQIENDLEYCIRGISLYDSGFDENAIQHGAYQLRYAISKLVAERLLAQATCLHDEDITVGFACAILVTTAPLFTLNSGLSLEDVIRADSIDAIVTEQELLVLWDSHAPDRSNYARKLYEQPDLEAINTRLKQYAKAFTPTKKIKYPPYEGEVGRTIDTAGDHILVVNHKHLTSVLKSLSVAATRATKSIETVATVEYDRANREVKIGSVATISPLSKTKEP